MSSTLKGTVTNRTLALAICFVAVLIVHPANPIAADPQRIIITVAGGGWPSDVPATSAPVGDPKRVAVDATGNLYVASRAANRVFKVDASGTLSLVAGNGGVGFNGDGGQAISATLSNPYDATVDAAGNVFIVDQGNARIRKVDTDGIITTVAGNGTSAFSGDSGPVAGTRRSSTTSKSPTARLSRTTISTPPT